MRTLGIALPVLGVLALATSALLWGCNSPRRGTAVPPARLSFTAKGGSPTLAAAQIPTARMPPQKSWILIDLPPGATQLQFGAEVYRLVCEACHGNLGQGLTDSWRATWAPQDQNCWQSKCHGPNHPPDGFSMPMAPAVVGSAALSSFVTARDLQDFVQRRMPWQDPGSLAGKDSWAATAYILKMNHVDPGADLSSESADHITILAATSLPAATPTPSSSHGNAQQWYSWWILAAAAPAAFGIYATVRILRRRAADGGH